MKMPDKIYIQEGLPGVYGINQQGGIKCMHAYIRKDIIIAWAIAKLERHTLKTFQGRMAQELIEKINEL